MKKLKNISIYFSDNEWEYITEKISDMEELYGEDVQKLGIKLSLTPSNFIKWATLINTTLLNKKSIRKNPPKFETTKLNDV